VDKTPKLNHQNLRTDQAHPAPPPTLQLYVGPNNHQSVRHDHALRVRLALSTVTMLEHLLDAGVGAQELPFAFDLVIVVAPDKVNAYGCARIKPLRGHR